MTAYVKLRGATLIGSRWWWRWSCAVCTDGNWPTAAYNIALEGALHHARTCPAIKLANMLDRYKSALESCEAAYSADQTQWHEERDQLRTDLDDAREEIARLSMSLPLPPCPIEHCCARPGSHHFHDKSTGLVRYHGVRSEGCGEEDADITRCYSAQSETPVLPPCPRSDCNAAPQWAAHHYHRWQSGDARPHQASSVCDDETHISTRCYSAHKGATS